MENIKLHRKQFIIVNTQFFTGELPDGFLTHKISDNVTLFHDFDLKISDFIVNKSKKVIILGTIIGKPLSEEYIQYNSGRYIAIIDDQLYLDALGSLGVFYNTKIQNNGIICTSSQALVANILGLPLVGRDLKFSSFNWDPVPQARLDGFVRLLHDQKINLLNMTVTNFDKSIDSEVISANVAAKELADELLKSVLLLSKQKRPIYLGLTAGSDSRLLLSVLLKANINFRAFTFNLNEDTTKIDSQIASQLCNKYEIPHEVITKQKPNDEALDIYLRHSGGAGGDRAHIYISGNYYRNIPKNAILLHGGAFEIGQRYFEKQLKCIDFNNPKNAVKLLQKKFSILDPIAKKNLEAWIIYRTKNPIKNMDWIDLFYLDQRRGGWGAANRQAEDCLDFDWIILANSWKIINTISKVSLADKINNTIQHLAMEMLVPGISKDIKINPPSIKMRFQKVLLTVIPRKFIPTLKKILCR